MTLRPARILVVDDDAGIRTMLELALGGRGYAVTTSDGRVGTEPGIADLVLLDARLGQGSAVGRWAGAGGRNAPPVVLMTAGYDAVRLGREIGAAGVLAKPFDLDLLFATIERCLEAAERHPLA